MAKEATLQIRMNVELKEKAVTHIGNDLFQHIHITDAVYLNFPKN